MSSKIIHLEREGLVINFENVSYFEKVEHPLAIIIYFSLKDSLTLTCSSKNERDRIFMTLLTIISD